MSEDLKAEVNIVDLKSQVIKLTENDKVSYILLTL